jgi:hypothetical protein
VNEQDVSVEAEDPFDGCEPLADLEYLGRAIVDADGMPSGSPANFEVTRGSTYPPGWVGGAVAAAAEILAAHREAMGSEWPPEPPEVPPSA